MNAELPPFKNGEHNSESASTIDLVITPLTLLTLCIFDNFALLRLGFHSRQIPHVTRSPAKKLNLKDTELSAHGLLL